MITPIPIEGIVYIYGTFAIDNERLNTIAPSRPVRPASVDTDVETVVRDRMAYHFDMYQQLRQLSWMQNSGSK